MQLSSVDFKDRIYLLSICFSLLNRGSSLPSNSDKISDCGITNVKLSL